MTWVLLYMQCCAYTNSLKHICTKSCDLYLHLQEGLECLGNGDLLQFFKFVDAVLDEGTQFIAVIQLLLPEGTRKQQ